jgi:hypothetical protein
LLRRWLSSRVEGVTEFWKNFLRVESGNILLAIILVALVAHHAADLWVGGVLGALLRGIESRRYPSGPPAVKA